jgi:hypothetical protein
MYKGTASLKPLIICLPFGIAEDKLAWFRDEEFARETLAGMNPLSIELVTACFLIDLA